MLAFLRELVARLHDDPRLAPALQRPQCLGNLLLASAIYRQLNGSLGGAELLASHEVVRTATIRGLAELCGRLGAPSQAVLPCTTTLAQLQVLYSNGVLVTSEEKSGRATRGYPVDRVLVEFNRAPFLHPEVVQLVREADIRAWQRYNGLRFLQCACRFTERDPAHENAGARRAAKALIAQLRRDNPQADYNLFCSTHKVNLGMVQGWQKNGEAHSFLDDYDTAPGGGTDE